jgi:hypothetical protein
LGGAFPSVGSLNPFSENGFCQFQVLIATHKMAELVDKIENVMRTVNPFGFTSLGGGDYYYEANNMVRLLPTYTGTILELCMDSFDIYYDHHPKWTELETAIAELFSKE